jgi:hypothetical protein
MTTVDRLNAIDAQINALAKERATLSAALYKASKTRYRTGKPKEAGVYHYSSTNCAAIGGGLGKWDGKQWNRFDNWGDFTNRGFPVVWYGEGKDGQQPIINPDRR